MDGLEKIYEELSMANGQKESMVKLEKEAAVIVARWRSRNGLSLRRNLTLLLQAGDKVMEDQQRAKPAMKQG